MTLKDLFDTEEEEKMLLACSLIQGMNKEKFMRHIHDWLWSMIQSTYAPANLRQQPPVYSFYSEDPYKVASDYYLRVYNHDGYYFNKFHANFRVEFLFNKPGNNYFGYVVEEKFVITVSKNRADFKKKNGSMIDAKAYFSNIIKAYDSRRANEDS